MGVETLRVRGAGVDPVAQSSASARVAAQAGLGYAAGRAEARLAIASGLDQARQERATVPGVQGGTSYGATDEFGRRSVEKVATVWDFYATVLHLLGFDHTKLTWYHNGLGRRLTDVHGRILHDLVA